jgi:hypothetical protein
MVPSEFFVVLSPIRIRKSGWCNIIAEGGQTWSLSTLSRISGTSSRVPNKPLGQAPVRTENTTVTGRRYLAAVEKIRSSGARTTLLAVGLWYVVHRSKKKSLFSLGVQPADGGEGPSR